MSIQIQPQANKVWQLVSSSSTLDAYVKVFTLTWDIIRETAILIWLGLCLVLVVFDWIWSFATNTWSNLQNLQNGSKDDDANIASNLGQTLVEVTKSKTVSAVAQAREQLGLPEKETPAPSQPAASTPSTAPATSAPASTPAPTAADGPAASSKE